MADELLRPIIGIENRTKYEVFNIMCDRIRHATRIEPEAADRGVSEADVERVAGAVHLARFPDPGRAYPYDEEDEGGKLYCRRIARAAIQSLRSEQEGGHD